VDSIAYGFLLFLMLKKFDKKPSIFFSLVGLFISILGILWVLSNIDKPFAQIFYPFIAALLGCFSIIVCLSIEARCKKNLFILYLSDVTGKTSYAVYLFHTLIICLVGNMLGATPLWLRFIVFVIGTAIIATLSTYLFEQPILQLRPRYNRVLNRESYHQEIIISQNN
jgi:peptidoglycan/LPS O-acetylase OafA/YrhL